MKQVKVLLGQFTFFDEQIDGVDKTIVHKIDKVVMVDEDKVDDFCEASLDEHEGYLIPEYYNFEIIYECDKPQD